MTEKWELREVKPRFKMLKQRKENNGYMISEKCIIMTKYTKTWIFSPTNKSEVLIPHEFIFSLK